MYRKILGCLLCLCLLTQGVQAESEKYVALTFDDGPSGRYTRQLLDGLKERGAKATFLLCGYRIKEYPAEAQRIADEGHEIGIHGYSHKNMKGMSRGDIAQEIQDTQALLPANCRAKFLRPPGGAVSDAVRQVGETMNLGILNWSVDPRDWAKSSSGAVEQMVVKNVTDGDVILLHDMTESSVKAALQIIDHLSQQGYRFVTVSELASLRGCPIKAGKTYCSFPAG